MKLRAFVDLVTDCQRRDFTFNAMAMTFDGVLIDPFNGQADLQNQIVRFVGDADARIKEDYLRIMRWFRFQARFGKQGHIDTTSWDAILGNFKGLFQISRERIWSELKRLVVHPRGSALFRLMITEGMGPYIFAANTRFYSMSNADTEKLLEWTSDPEVVMAAWTRWEYDMVDQLAASLKWSSDERDHALWLCKHAFQKHDLRRLIAVDNAPRKWVADLAALEDRDAWNRNALVHWAFDPFPVNGKDLMQAGVQAGPVMGKILRKLKDDWADSGYVATKDELMATVVV